jgi:hypothetical protein
MNRPELLAEAHAMLPGLMQELRPDQDPAPMLVVKTRAHKPIPFILLKMDRTEMLDALRHILRTHNATAALLMTVAWEAPAGVRPSLHPDRVETIVLGYASKWTAAIESARIIRHKDAPPTLGEFWRNDAPYVGHGLFIDALREGLGWTTWGVSDTPPPRP